MSGSKRRAAWYAIGLPVVRSEAASRGKASSPPDGEPLSRVAATRGLEFSVDSSMTWRARAITGPGLSSSISVKKGGRTIAIPGIIRTISEDVPAAPLVSGESRFRPVVSPTSRRRVPFLAWHAASRTRTARAHDARTREALHPMFSGARRDPQHSNTANGPHFIASARAHTSKREGISMLLAPRPACAKPSRRRVARTGPSQDHLLTSCSHELPARLGPWRQRPSQRSRSRRNRSGASLTASAVRAALARSACGLPAVIQGVRLFERPLAPFPRQ